MPSSQLPFDPELGAFLTQLAGVLPASVTPEMIVPLRSAPMPSLTLEKLRERFDAEERTVPGPTGAPQIRLLIVRPRGVKGLLPGIFHTHGGGMIVGDRFTGLETLAEWMEAIPMVVVSVEYRLAPEHPHPALTEDCYAGLRWAGDHLEELGIDRSRLLVAGASAGGGLAAAMALMARDRKGPKLAGQILMCPMIDDRAVTPSSRELVAAGIWDSVSNATGWNALLGTSTAGPDVSEYAAPARATNLAGLPPAYIDVGTVETFRDEDIDYAARLLRAGVQTELHVWAGGFHGFDRFAPDATLSRECRARRIDWLKRLLRR